MNACELKWDAIQNISQMGNKVLYKWDRGTINHSSYLPIPTGHDGTGLRLDFIFFEK